MKPGKILGNPVSIWDRFASDQRGNVAMMFGLSVIPLMLVAGAAVDTSRLTSEKARLQSAIDAAALSLMREPKSTTQAVLRAKAKGFFAASFLPDAGGTVPNVQVTFDNGRIQVFASQNVETAFMRIVGINNIPISARTEVTNERKKIEIALVLDNTGSMGSAGKMPALKTAVGNMIDYLTTKRTSPEEVKMALVPFNTQVKIDTSHSAASWLRWDVVLENTSLSWSQRQPPAPGDWTGCISDRDQPWDVKSEAPNLHFSRYVASKCHASQVKLEPLTTNLETIRTGANAMVAGGFTNVTIGLTMGLAALRPDSPLGSASSSDPLVEKFVILLTDGDNTRNRWSSSQSDIDARLTQACNQARARKINVFTIRVINGNASLLQSCATKPDMYYNVNDASQLDAVFKKILESIEGVRITS